MVSVSLGEGKKSVRLPHRIAREYWGIVGWNLAPVAVIGAFLFVLGSPALSRAEAVHRVKSGDTMTRIAKKYGVSVRNLAAANRLKRDSMLRVGRKLKVPAKGAMYVTRGDSLNKLARRYKLSAKKLARHNGLKMNAKLRPGQRLMLPGRETPSSRAAAKRKKLSRKLTFLRPAHNESLALSLFDLKGRARPASRKKLAWLLRDRTTGSQTRPSLPLLRLLANIGANFDGKPIVIVSGYRDPSGNTGETSRHASGNAVDIRVEGVSNEDLRDFCRDQRYVGVGFYPRSTFVHIDVRKRSAYWVDWSRPGESPLYLPPGEVPEDELAQESP